MTRDRFITGLCLYNLRTQDSMWVTDIDHNRRAVSFFGDRTIAMAWLRTPEAVDAWVAEVQALVPHVRIRAERVQ